MSRAKYCIKERDGKFTLYRREVANFGRWAVFAEYQSLQEAKTAMNKDIAAQPVFYFFDRHGYVCEQYACE